MNSRIRFLITGFAAGIITGILGSGGGMILIPLLSVFCHEEEDCVFPCSLGIMLPICLCSLLVQGGISALPFRDIRPYLVGGSIGGILSVLTARKISPAWLHKLFGCILLWSGFRCLIS